MVQLMNRSIDLMDQYATEAETGFAMNRRGYLYLTATKQGLERISASARQSVESGAGSLRMHSGSASEYRTDSSAGADLFTDGESLRRWFPYVAPHSLGGIHARNAGWLSAQQLGMWMLDQARAAGASTVSATVADVDIDGDEVRGVELEDGTRVASSAFVNAAGPMLRRVGLMAGTDLPVFSEAHLKTTFRDTESAIPRDAPMMIWTDPQQVAWRQDEAGLLLEEGRGDLLDVLPPGCHARPEGGAQSPWVIGLWEYGAREIEPTWPVPQDPLYTEVVLRGLASMIPNLESYFDRLPESTVDGGYYTKTVENRPLAGPVGPVGSYVCGALSGYGIMAACAVGELVAAAIAGVDLPSWAWQFDLRRYDDPGYVRSIRGGDSGQL